LPRRLGWFDLTLRQTFGRSLLLVRPKRSGRHRAFRKPTLDSSRVYVRFSFQGPRQLWKPLPRGAVFRSAWGRESYSRHPIRQLLFSCSVPFSFTLFRVVESRVRFHFIQPTLRRVMVVEARQRRFRAPSFGPSRLSPLRRRSGRRFRSIRRVRQATL